MKSETKVGLLFIGSVIMVLAFAYFLGFVRPFSDTKELVLLYNFAGGIEEGSKVRAMGIDVGKVKSIEFTPDFKMTTGEEVKLKITVEIQKKAWSSIRKDSRFYINLAGVIGEKYVEVSPGSTSQPEFSDGELVRGEDPPRIDQLLSQGYALAGKILDMVEKNEGTVVDTLEKMNDLVTNLNKTLVIVERLAGKKEFNQILTNVNALTSDMLIVTSKLRGPEAQKTMQLMHDLLWRLEKMDSKAIKKFLQEEGIKAKLF